MQKRPSGGRSILKKGLGMCWEMCLGVAGHSEVRYEGQELAVMVAA